MRWQWPTSSGFRPARSGRCPWTRSGKRTLAIRGRPWRSRRVSKRFHQWESWTPGHPKHFLAPGIETTTGPLGQGISNAVGMAMAEKFLGQRYNRPGHTVVDHRIYGIASDGDLMEGVSQEAASLAGAFGLGKLTFFYDDNRITIDGTTALSFDSEDKGKRFEAYGWHVQ